MRRYALLFCYMLLFPLLLSAQRSAPAATACHLPKLCLSFRDAKTNALVRPYSVTAYFIHQSYLFTIRSEDIFNDTIDQKLRQYTFWPGDVLILFFSAHNMNDAYDTLRFPLSDSLVTHTVRFQPRTILDLYFQDDKGSLIQPAHIQYSSSRNHNGSISIEPDDRPQLSPGEIIARSAHAGDTIILWSVAKGVLPAFDTLFMPPVDSTLHYTVRFHPLKRKNAVLLPAVDLDPMFVSALQNHDATSNEAWFTNCSESADLLVFFLTTNTKTRISLSLFYPDAAGIMRYNSAFTHRLYGSYFNLGVPYHRMKVKAFKALPAGLNHAAAGTKSVAFITIRKS